MILACNNISKTFGVNEILKNITFNINDKEKVALIGVNGAGKSTLFKIITGEDTADSGDVIISKNTNIGYFSQTLDIDNNNKIFDELLTVFSEIIELERRLVFLENEMENLSEGKLEENIKEYTNLSNYMNENNFFNYKNKIKSVLKGLGFLEEDFFKEINSFSGGQKTRIALAKILLKEPNILLLDEPTNHLDISSIQWLENYLKGYNGAVLIISHDRYFLNKIVEKVIEIENKKATVFLGNYSQYSIKKQDMREVLLKQYLNQQKQIAKQQESIRQLKDYNSIKSMKRAESKEKQLAKMEKIEKPENLPASMKLTLKPKKESGNDVLSVNNLKKSFEELLFENINFEIKKGEKVALIGANGIGKTTLFNIILNKLEYDFGNIKIGSNVTIGYYDQQQEDLNMNNTIFEEISNTFPYLKNEEIRNALAIFVFTGDDVFKKISTLSGGEKGRVALAKIMLSNANFLILDEPTNHLDINSKEILENAIKNYSGTCIYISHDRFFINNTATKVIELTKNKANIYLGNYDYYLEKAKEKEINLNLKITKIANASETKLDWKAQKEAQAEARKKENAIKKLEKEIEETEEKIKEKDETLALEEIYTNAMESKKILKEKAILEEKLNELYEKWEELN